MAEYIKREALIEKLRTMPIPKQAGSANTWLDNCAAGVNAAIREVASFPAADVVPVVRCKDCRKIKSYECPMYFVNAYGDFCSYGERKGGAADG